MPQMSLARRTRVTEGLSDADRDVTDAEYDSIHIQNPRILEMSGTRQNPNPLSECVRLRGESRAEDVKELARGMHNIDCVAEAVFCWRCTLVLDVAHDTRDAARISCTMGAAVFASLTSAVTA